MYITVWRKIPRPTISTIIYLNFIWYLVRPHWMQWIPICQYECQPFLVAAFTHHFPCDLQRFRIDIYISVGVDLNVHCARCVQPIFEIINIRNDCNSCKIEIEFSEFIKRISFWHFVIRAGNLNNTCNGLNVWTFEKYSCLDWTPQQCTNFQHHTR